MLDTSSRKPRTPRWSPAIVTATVVVNGRMGAAPLDAPYSLRLWLLWPCPLPLHSRAAADRHKILSLPLKACNVERGSAGRASKFCHAHKKVPSSLGCA
jgi:hypothetical protein